MDLMHLLSSESSSEQEPGQWREVLYKRKGINFSTTTSEGRLLRSSQVNTKRSNERQENYANRRNLISKGPPETKEEKKEKKEVSKKAQEDRKTGDDGRGTATTTKSRRDKLNEFLEKKRIIEEAKKKKAKPAFRAGKVQHSYSSSSCPGPVSEGCSLSQSLMSSTTAVFKKPQGGNGKMLRSYSTLSLQRGPSQASQRNPSQASKQKSFAPCNYKFSLNMKYNNTSNETKTSNKQNKSTIITARKEAENDAKSVDKESPKQEVEVVRNLKENSPSVEIREEEEETQERKVEGFRILLKSETERIHKLCEKWEELLQPGEDLAEDVAGEVRSVLGLARLVVAERFSQFAGLIDNCQFRRGEKETKVEDLQGFWEMISLQVEDVDKKFVSLEEMKANDWERPKEHRMVEKTTRQKSVSTSSQIKTKPATQASSGLKALIAARRKAAGSQRASENGVSPTPDSLGTGTPPEGLKMEPPEMTFDGGFFRVTSPCLRKTPKLKSSSLKLMQTAVGNSANKLNINTNTMLLSPFISAVAKLSLSSGSVPTRLFSEGEVGEEIPSETLAEKAEVVEDPIVAGKAGCFLEVEAHQVTPESCVDLMFFDSPLNAKKL